MSSIQVHHAMRNFGSPGKIKNWNWQIFDMHEIGETIDAIKEFTNRTRRI
jgi:hypothetical protein